MQCKIGIRAARQNVATAGKNCFQPTNPGSLSSLYDRCRLNVAAAHATFAGRLCLSQKPTVTTPEVRQTRQTEAAIRGSWFRNHVFGAPLVLRRSCIRVKSTATSKTTRAYTRVLTCMPTYIHRYVQSVRCTFLHTYLDLHPSIHACLYS